MIPPKTYKNENERLAALASYNIMDSEREQEYDDLTMLASEICGTKISLISLLDDKRQWFKSRVGLESTETPKEFAFCGHAINNPKELFEVTDAKIDERFYDNPLVTGSPNISFYAGIPLLSDGGYPLGTLCVIDDTPKKLSDNQIKALKILAKQATNLMELRRKNKKLRALNELLEEKNKQIARFANMAAHDLKSPLGNIESLVSILFEDKVSFNEEQIEVLQMISTCANQLRNLIDELLDFSKIDNLSLSNKEAINAASFIENLKKIIQGGDECVINLNSKLDVLVTNKAALTIIFLNLITNSVKYSDKDVPVMDIEISEDSHNYYFKFKDNGPGIDANKVDEIFKPFNVMAQADKYGKTGHGLGLASVKNVIEKYNGTIILKSGLGEGVNYSFYFKK